MRVELDACGQGEALPATSVAFESGAAARLVAETEQRPTVLGLLASGRMRPSTGRVLLDGAPALRGTRRDLRRRVALVDAPSVSEPDGRVSLAGVLAEELLFAGIPGDPVSVRRWAEQLALPGLDRPLAEVDPRTRLRALTEIAILRDDIEALVLVSPDRHGGDPDAWWRQATSLADRGFAVLAIVGAATDATLASTERPETTDGHRAQHARDTEGRQA